MKDRFVSIDGAGRIVLPKEMRDELVIRPGDLLKVSIQGNEVTLRPSEQKAGFVRKGKALIFSRETADVLGRDMVEEILTQEREERASRVTSEFPERRRV
jgi:AbrB family looped-hinge helix DNA binding protein